MGGVAKTVKKANFGDYALGGTGLLLNNITGKHLGSGYGLLSKSKPTNPSYPDFNISPEEIGADQEAIRNLGDQQFADTNSWNVNDQSNRESARQRLADALIKQSQSSFQQSLPATLEDLNARHLLNGSGLGQEIARQQANVATNIANQVGVVGANDINRMSDVGLQALQAKQGMGQSALSRGFSLEDFVRQANVAKAIGAQAAPQVPSGKGNMVSGLGAGAAAGAPFGPYGAAIGGVSGALLGGAGKGR